MKIMMIAGLADSLVNFRGPLIKALVQKGCEVHAIAPNMLLSVETVNSLRSWGVCVHQIKMNRTGKNPFQDLYMVCMLWRLMRIISPNIVLGYTIKPVIFGAMAAWLARVPKRVALITGLGYTFQSDRRFLQWLVEKLYAFSLSKVDLVFFQNPDDVALFKVRGILGEKVRSCVLNGSGVDVAHFAEQALPKKSICFLLIARFLAAKGLREFAQAAYITKQRFPHVKFSIVGWVDENPDAIRQEELDGWITSGLLEYWGRLKDVRPAIARSSVYVLPSYREGTPRSVLEAMSMGRAIITTDAPGCRETVIHGDNGFLVPIKSVEALVASMAKFIEHPELIVQMGQRSRQIAVEKYDVHKVNSVMLKEMEIT